MAKRAPCKPKKSQPTAEQIEQAIVDAAQAKQRRNVRLTAEETAAIRRHDKAEQERQRERAFRQCPKKFYKQMSGRDDKVLLAQADRYGLPLRGREVDVTAVIRRFHDLFAERRHQLGGDEDAELESGPPSDAMERLRNLKCQLVEIELAERREQLVPRESVTNILSQLASIIRRAGERLRDHYGHDAADMLGEAIDSMKDIEEQSDL